MIADRHHFNNSGRPAPIANCTGSLLNFSYVSSMKHHDLLLKHADWIIYEGELIDVANVDEG
jgi:hypothetical protein